MSSFPPLTITYKGEEILLTSAHPLSQQVHNGARIEGEDQNGAYRILPLNNKIGSKFHGGVFLISPEYAKEIEDFSWLGHQNKDSTFVRRVVNRRGKQELLSRRIAALLFSPAPNKVFCKGHPLDYRSPLIHPYREKEKLYYGVQWHKKRQRYRMRPLWQPQESTYTKTEAEAARAYNTALRAEQKRHKGNPRHPIHTYPYNEVTPMF